MVIKYDEQEQCVKIRVFQGEIGFSSKLIFIRRSNYDTVKPGSILSREYKNYFPVKIKNHGCQIKIFTL